MRDLAAAMNARVGAARDMNGYVLLTEFTDGLLDGILNRRNAGLLTLPARERAAIIFDCNFPALNCHRREIARFTCLSKGRKRVYYHLQISALPVPRQGFLKTGIRTR